MLEVGQKKFYLDCLFLNGPENIRKSLKGEIRKTFEKRFKTFKSALTFQKIVALFKYDQGRIYAHILCLFFSLWKIGRR